MITPRVLRARDPADEGECKTKITPRDEHSLWCSSRPTLRVHAAPPKRFSHLRLHRGIHLDERRPGAFETFTGKFLRRVNAEFAAAGDFPGGVVEHVGQDFGESLRTAIMQSRGGSVLAQRRKRTSLVWCMSSAVSTTLRLRRCSSRCGRRTGLRRGAAPRVHVAFLEEVGFGQKVSQVRVTSLESAANSAKQKGSRLGKAGTALRKATGTPKAIDAPAAPAIIDPI